VIDDQFKTSVLNIKYIGKVTLDLCSLTRQKSIATVEYIQSGHGHVNYNMIPSMVYTRPEVAWVRTMEQGLKKEGIGYHVPRFPFPVNSGAKIDVYTEGQVKVLVEEEMDRILWVYITGECSCVA
jgi:dihydrolipoamide dehydrogenase